MSRRQQIAFVVWFLVTIFIVPLSQASMEIASGEVPRCLALFRMPPTAASLRSFETSIENASIFAKTVRPALQTLWFFILRNPGEKAIAGYSDWFFYKPDVRYLTEAPPIFEDSMRAIAQYSRDLNHLGIHLLVVPVPGKPTVHTDKLTSRVTYQRTAFRSQTQDLIARLGTLGIETLDLFSVFAATHPSYLERDTHWSAETAALAARLTAARLRDLSWAPPADTKYETRPVTVQRRGDIIHMIGAPQVERFYPPEEVLCRQVFDASTDKPYTDDPQASVLVLGDSFLRMYQTDAPRAAGYIAHLARELGTPVASIVNDGGASTLVREELLSRPELLDNKKLVIWEFVERDLKFGTEGWKQVPLPQRRTMTAYAGAWP